MVGGDPRPSRPFAGEEVPKPRRRLALLLAAACLSRAPRTASAAFSAPSSPSTRFAARFEAATSSSSATTPRIAPAAPASTAEEAPSSFVAGAAEPRLEAAPTSPGEAPAPGVGGGGGGGRASEGRYDWSFLDAVYLITCPNADPESKRLTKAMGILTELGLSDRVEIKRFKTDDEDRIRGCYTSHLSVMRDAMGTIEGSRPTRRGEDRVRGPGWWQQLMPLLGGIEEEEEKGTAAVNGDGGARSSAHVAAPDGGNARILILEDNLYIGASRLRQSTIDAVSGFASDNPWDIIHLSYIPYVPDLVVTRTASDGIVKLSCGIGSALGTTAYVIGTSGMEALIREDDERGYRAAIPDVMAELFPETRYAALPTPFLRAPQIRSLVNPQLDDLRSILFQPAVVGTVQMILPLTGLKSNDLLFATVGALLGVGALAGRMTVDAGWELATTGRYEGNVVLPLLSSAFSMFSLAVLAQGAALAPKPPPPEPEPEVALEAVAE